jgi:MFS family permease
VLTPLAGWLTDRVGPRIPAVAGALVAAAGLVALAYLQRTDPLSSVLWRSGLVGAGIGLSLPALLAAGMSVVPGGVKGAGSGMLNTARQLGFLLGVAILVAVFAHTMNGAVNQAADRGQALVRADAALSDPVRARLVSALDQARTIDATAGMDELRRIAHPIAEDIGQDVGFFEGLELLKLKDTLENLLWDEVSYAFRWPFLVAAIAAGLGALAGAFLPRRLARSQP